MAQPKLSLVTGHDDALSGSEASVAATAVSQLARQHLTEKLRIVEAMLFAAKAPLTPADIGQRLPPGEDVAGLLAALRDQYAGRGVTLMQSGGTWMFHTAADLGYLLATHRIEAKTLSRAALETLSIIAYHQPVTRAEIEEIRGVSTSKGSIDVLLDTRWIKPRGRRRAPGRPLTYGTTDAFLQHFGLQSVKDLPGLAELKGAGLLSSSLPPGFTVPEPRDVAALMPDELPLEASDEDAAEVEAEVEAAAEAEAELVGEAKGEPALEAPGGGDEPAGPHAAT